MQYFVETAAILKNGRHIEFFGWLTCFIYSTMFRQHMYKVRCLLHKLKDSSIYKLNLLDNRTNSQLDNWYHSDAVQKADLLVLKELQQEHFLKDIKLLSEKKQLSKDSRIAHLAPFLN